MDRGEVWEVTFDPTVGAEIRKARPAVIISRRGVGILPLRVVVPFTSWRDGFATVPWMVRVDPSPENGLSRPSAADAFQVHSYSVRRLVRKLGALSETDLRRIVVAVGDIIEHP